MAGRGGSERRGHLIADDTDALWASPLERAPLGGRALLDDIVRRERGCEIRVRLKDRAQQHFGIGVRDRAIDPVGRADFAQPSLIQNRNPVRQR
jgi:hypothetical protein